LAARRVTINDVARAANVHASTVSRVLNGRAELSLLPETHIAVLEAGRIVATMEQAWDRLRVERGALPRAVNFISGPSRTADIEQTVTLGAHGPYRVLIIIVG